MFYCRAISSLSFLGCCRPEQSPLLLAVREWGWGGHSVLAYLLAFSQALWMAASDAMTCEQGSSTLTTLEVSNPGPEKWGCPPHRALVLFMQELGGMHD